MWDISRETHQRRQRDKENLLNSSGEEGEYNFIFYSHLKKHYIELHLRWRKATESCCHCLVVFKQTGSTESWQKHWTTLTVLLWGSTNGRSLCVQYPLNTELALQSGYRCVRGISVCVRIRSGGWSWGVSGVSGVSGDSVTVLPFCSFSLPPDSTPLGSMPVGVSPFSVSTLSLSSLNHKHTNMQIIYQELLPWRSC